MLLFSIAGGICERIATHPGKPQPETNKMGNTRAMKDEYVVKNIPENKWSVYRRSVRKWIGQFTTRQAAQEFAKLAEKAYGPKTSEIEQIGEYYIVWRRVKNERWLITFTTKTAAERLADLLMKAQ